MGVGSDREFLGSGVVTRGVARRLIDAQVEEKVVVGFGQKGLRMVGEPPRTDVVTGAELASSARVVERKRG